MPRIYVYCDSDGREPFTRWLDGLPRSARARITEVIARIMDGNLGDVRSVGEGVHERRVHFGPGYRIYFAWDGPELIVLLGGGDKDGQRRDIRASHRHWRDYKIRQGR